MRRRGRENEWGVEERVTVIVVVTHRERSFAIASLDAFTLSSSSRMRSIFPSTSKDPSFSPRFAPHNPHTPVWFRPRQGLPWPPMLRVCGEEVLGV